MSESAKEDTDKLGAPVVDAHVHGQEAEPSLNVGVVNADAIAILRRLWVAAGDNGATRSEKGRYLGQQAVAALQVAMDALRGWQSIETAPKDGTPIIVLTELGNIIKAETSDVVTEDGWAWVASNEDVHPPCWTDGVCWAENADDEPSDPPRFWMPLLPSPKE